MDEAPWGDLVGAQDVVPDLVRAREPEPRPWLVHVDVDVGAGLAADQHPEHVLVERRREHRQPEVSGDGYRLDRQRVGLPILGQDFLRRLTGLAANLPDRQTTQHVRHIGSV